LQQKASGVQSEEQVLHKSFKYFDLNNSGAVEPDEFAKACEKIGIMIPTKQDLEALFSIYDRDNSGSIDYKEFSSSLYGRPMTASSTGGNGGARAPEELAEAMRQKLASRGARGFVGLQR
jgi:Ca2+-binding EF-hand superfamily protein